MAAALGAYLHFLAIFDLFALLSVEHVLFKAPPTTWATACSMRS